MSVIDVSLACGFSSASHFARCYRAHFSETPHRMRA
ncbi:MAG TPA: helix-turn-helix domain-containing protein [Nordella sp.]|nr:helix-turn-helix domain-containing protein [Nordella sp.]